MSARERPAPGGVRFWEAVRAEMRATWWGRWRWLWLGLGVIILGGTLLWCLGILRWDWLVLLPLVLVFWPPTWLGSDLLSIRFPENPEPLRKWRPMEFLARFLGRLGPLLALTVVTSVPFTRAVLVDDQSSLRAWIREWAALTALLLATALCYAAVAGLLSSFSQRPRRGLTTMLLALGSFLSVAGDIGEDSFPWWYYVVAPGFGVWVRLEVWLVDQPWMRYGFRFYNWYRAIIFLTVATLAGLWIWWIAARRYRRSRPYHANE